MPRELQYLSKRRKNQLIRQRIESHGNLDMFGSGPSSDCTLHAVYKDTSNTTTHSTSVNVINDDLTIGDNTQLFRSSSLESSSSTLCTSPILWNYGEDVVQNDMEQHTINSGSNFSVEIYDVKNIDNTFDFNERSKNKNSLENRLRSWVNAERIAHGSVTKLLKMLRDCGYESLPKDVRTLMHTPRSGISEIMKTFNNGVYVHFGLVNNLQRSIGKHLEEVPKSVKLLINCDGMSLSKSSGSQFWPILVSIQADVYTEPFAVGIYHGYSKPENANEFVRPFINEIIKIEQNGFFYGGKKCVLEIAGIVCDAPAMSFLMCTKSHSGYFCCHKCTQEGEYIKSVVFPEINFTMRTDKSFRNKEQDEHHTGDTILQKLNIDMVSQVAIDYMHLVCLGVMKRLLLFWIRGPKNCRLSKNNQKYLSDTIVATKCSIPSEFSRLPRSLAEVDKWKATEFRLFLLYIGPVILKPLMSSVYYTHFLTLSIAIRLLCDPNVCMTLNEYSDQLLKYFVNKYKTLYGRQYMSYNIHNLLHLANDVKTFGPLDKFSCFKFENYLRKVRDKMQHSPKPLQQIYNRLHEENEIPVLKEPNSYPIIHYAKSGSHINSVELKEFTITDKHPNNCCLLKNEAILFVRKIIYDNELYIIGDEFRTVKSLFDKPCNSLKLNISELDISPSDENVRIPLSNVKTKCIKCIYSRRESPVIIPLLHHLN
ncbi:uncharacterized protein LOC116849334 [Odontomachus brunneus]|uniref:uncharacterized protein LOC116849334 n=1 Tax=Odontomachus brunneus TaxID=486640 RepID=UPI0013F24BD3|nr:uncharacterized protein LOC116849334 [Odontomachus brunneus]XP_032682278.1 uncharacterized protein LOC116849334 [Odontomachus brunneus]XP_032682279.1 uncharacterized protein LOC116849334 [Odontomachus brunneus]XP_032682280.1 uncharacterized protein LOC116849334 [Odontomachus brunneus]